ncbi:hypothetical protein HK104_002646 [Borealophlyctis nickersoniae]|nr:hypothetical protein HK104_002646 [Borealophlyctis nickersoniae]
MATTTSTKKARTNSPNATPDHLPHTQRPALPGSTQTKLTNLGARVRKSINDGYKIKKANPVAPPISMSLSSSTATPSASSTSENPLKRRITDYFAPAVERGGVVEGNVSVGDSH